MDPQDQKDELAIKIVSLSHGQRPTKGQGKKRKGVDEYAADNRDDFTTSSIEKDGQIVRVLVCRFCSQTIGARSDRIKEHLISQRHHKNKQAKGGLGAADNFSDSSQDFQENTMTPMAKKVKIKHRDEYTGKEDNAAKQKRIEDYAKEHSEDFTTRTIEKEGHLVHFLFCRFCNRPVGARSDRIKEHVTSQRHQKNKLPAKFSQAEPLESAPLSIATVTSEVREDSVPRSMPKLKRELTDSELLEAKARELIKLKLVDINKMIRECKLCRRIVLISDVQQEQKKMLHHRYKCSRCNFEGSSREEYRTHVSLHDYLSPCACGQSFVNRTTLKIQALKNCFHSKEKSNGLKPPKLSIPSPPQIPYVSTAIAIATPRKENVVVNPPNLIKAKKSKIVPITTTTFCSLLPEQQSSNVSPVTTSIVSDWEARQSFQESFEKLVPQYNNSTNDTINYNMNNFNNLDIFEHFNPLSNSTPSLGFGGIGLIENYCGLEVVETKSENYITLQLDFSEY